MARKLNTRQQRPSVPVVIGAGITEQWYFTHLQRLLNCRVKIRPRFFGQEDVFQIGKKIDKVLRDGGTAIAVFDADVASWDQKERDKLCRLKAKYSGNPRVVLCDSMPSIEYWFLIHFVDIRRLFPDAQSVVKELLKHLPDYCKKEAFLSKPEWVKVLTSSRRMDHAIAVAGRSEPGQSYTNLPRAFKMVFPQ